MSALVHVIPSIVERTKREVVLIGGLAVMCRLNQPYRVTTDLDTVNRRGDSEPAQLELLLASGAERTERGLGLMTTVSDDAENGLTRLVRELLEQQSESRSLDFKGPMMFGPSKAEKASA